MELSQKCQPHHRFETNPKCFDVRHKLETTEVSNNSFCKEEGEWMVDRLYFSNKA